VLDYRIEPIGWVCNRRDEIEDDHWDDIGSTIELSPLAVEPESTLALADFSHVVVVYVFDRVDEVSVCRGARHPRGRADWPLVGILAQRAKDRPNRLGVTVCRLVRVDGLHIEVEGLDAIAGTPVVDIKPYMVGFGPRGAVREPPWATSLMADYW